MYDPSSLSVLLLGRLCCSFLLALLPKSVTPEDVVLRVVSHFTDFSSFLLIVHIFKDSIIVLFFNLYFRDLYEFVCEGVTG